MRLIDADALARKWQDVLDSKPDEKETVAYQTFELFIERLAHEPTIGPESLRPKGTWRKYSSDEWICSNCGYDKYCDTLDGGTLPDFCEGCGADMRGGADE